LTTQPESITFVLVLVNNEVTLKKEEIITFKTTKGQRRKIKSLLKKIGVVNRHQQSENLVFALEDYLSKIDGRS